MQYNTAVFFKMAINPKKVANGSTLTIVTSATSPKHSITFHSAEEGLVADYNNRRWAVTYDEKHDRLLLENGPRPIVVSLAERNYFGEGAD